MVDLYAMAFTAGRSRAPYDRFPVEESAGRKIAILHGSLDVDWSDRSMPLRSENLATLGVDYLALGHIHKPMDRRLDKAWACYPGRIEGGGFDDPGGAGLVTIDAAATELRPERTPFPSRPVREEWTNLSGFTSEAELTARIESVVDPRAIVRLEFTGAPGFELRPEKLRLQFAAKFHHLEIGIDEAASLPGDLEGAGAEATVRGLFARLAAEKIAAAPAGQKDLLEAAFRFGWSAFGGGPGNKPGTGRRG
jgi:DNA repair exonuclease SbcCD nuclease subunit